MRLITYWVGEQTYGLPLLLVGEFYSSVQATRFDAGDSRIYGITHIRGGSAVVLDMRSVSGRTNGTVSQPNNHGNSFAGCDMVYIHSQDHLCEEARSQGLRAFDEPTVLVVDRLAGIRDVDRNDMHRTPAHLDADFYEGVFEIDCGDLIFLNYAKLVQSILTDVRELNK